MFTGIVEETGTVEMIGNGKIIIKADKIFSDMHIGDSIAVNGVCLTVSAKGSGVFTADVMGETVRRTSLSSLSKGKKVNLERAMSANGRFGGHIIQGHVDGIGKIEEIKRENNAVWIKISADKHILDMTVEKGSIAIDGISLTVAYIDSHCFAVSIIPHTGEETTLLSKNKGDIVNLETDIVGRYIYKFMNLENDTSSNTPKKSITSDFLSENGFI